MTRDCSSFAKPYRAQRTRVQARRYLAALRHVCEPRLSGCENVYGFIQRYKRTRRNIKNKNLLWRLEAGTEGGENALPQPCPPNSRSMSWSVARRASSSQKREREGEMIKAAFEILGAQVFLIRFRCRALCVLAVGVGAQGRDGAARQRVIPAALRDALRRALARRASSA